MELRAMRAFGIMPNQWDNLDEHERVTLMAYEQHRFETLANQLDRMTDKEANTPEVVATIVVEMI
jgi:hypothetical protein